MSRRKPKAAVKLTELDFVLGNKLQSPLVCLMGPSRQIADFFANREHDDDLVYHMDLFESGKLKDEMTRREVDVEIIESADLWDLDKPVQTVIYPVPYSGERTLKLDMVEHAYHVLAPGGTLIVVTPYDKDQLFQSLLKKVFGRVHIPAAGQDSVLWSQRRGERPRRRHEVTFNVRAADGPSFHFVSRPGIFSYGRFDNGARALVETMFIEPGNSILDLGCGCGTNGIIAGRQAGPDGDVVFVDSNLRALALAELNAAANGLPRFRSVRTTGLDELPLKHFDAILANPPYFAQNEIAEHFTELSHRLLSENGRFYLVTKQPNEIGAVMADFFHDVEMELRRGYAVMCAADPI